MKILFQSQLSHTNTLSFVFAHSSEFFRKVFMKPLKGDIMCLFCVCVYMMCKLLFMKPNIMKEAPF